MDPIRVVFMGTPPLAARVLAQLLTAANATAAAGQGAAPPRYRVLEAWTQPDKRAGRGRTLQPPAVKVLAEAHDVPVWQPKRLRDGVAEARLRALRPDVVVVAAYGRILPPALLAVPPAGCINVHASLLPRWRGASPIACCLLHGDAQTGVSIMRMDVGCDTGPVFGQASLDVAADETTGTLTDRLAELGAATLVQWLPGIVAGTHGAQPQPESGITHAPLLTKADGALDFAHPAEALARQVRALSPWPSSFAAYNDQRFIVVRAHVAPNDDTAYTGRCGEVLEAAAQGLRVACGRGSLWLTQVKPAGSGQMHAAQWIGGRGPQKGATLVKVTQQA